MNELARAKLVLTRLYGNRSKPLGLGLLSSLAILAPLAARAATSAGGGGMPYSSGLNTFATSVQGEVAFIIILIAIVAGVGAFIFMGGLEVLLTTIGKTIIGIGIVGAVVAFATLAGVTGAIV